MSRGLIMVVEDEQHIREPLAHLLRMRHFRVVTAETVDEAVELLSAYRPDAAIVDLRLRQGSGRDVIVRVPVEAPVIIFTATACDSGDLERLRPRTRLIEKPCSLSWLIDTLDEMIESTREYAIR